MNGSSVGTSKLNVTLGIKRPFFYFLVGGTITDFFFSLSFTWVASGYICELALSSLYNVHSVSLCLPCCFLYLPGHCYLSSARAPVITGMVTSSFVFWIPWDQGSSVGGGGQRHTDTSVTSSFVRFTGSNMMAWGKGFQASMQLLLSCPWLWVLL